MLNAQNISLKKVVNTPKTYIFTADKKVSVRFTEDDLTLINKALIKDGFSTKKRSVWIDSCVRKLLSLDVTDFDFIFDSGVDLIHLGTKLGAESRSIPVGLSSSTFGILEDRVNNLESVKNPHLIRFAIDFRMSNLGR